MFVYGTLKRGFCRHFALKNQTFISEARTANRYRMFNVGTYPGLIDAHEGGVSISGEVWEVSADCLLHLDEVEGVDERLYERRRIELESPEHDPVEAYFYLRSVQDCPDCGEAWVDELSRQDHA